MKINNVSRQVNDKTLAPEIVFDGVIDISLPLFGQVEIERFYKEIGESFVEQLKEKIQLIK